jgi:hypothetical protein
MINIYTPSKIKVAKNTIFNDQLYYLADGTIVNIWLVLAHPKSPPIPEASPWKAEALLEA